MRVIILHVRKGTPLNDISAFVREHMLPGDEVHMVGSQQAKGLCGALQALGAVPITHPTAPTDGHGNKQRDTYRRLIRSINPHGVMTLGITDTAQALVACARNHEVPYVQA